MHNQYDAKRNQNEEVQKAYRKRSLYQFVVIKSFLCLTSLHISLPFEFIHAFKFAAPAPSPNILPISS